MLSQLHLLPLILLSETKHLYSLPRIIFLTCQDEVKAKIAELTKQVQEQQEQQNLLLRRLETTLQGVSKSLGTLSETLNQVQRDMAKSGGSIKTIESTLRKLSTELERLETKLKEHMSGHVGVLSASLVGRGGFWSGIWLVIGVQAAGWVIYELYQRKKDYAKKFL
jgi:septal ring factor EnvC (AmiA/AmiB activator)